MEDFVVDLNAGRQQLLARNSNFMMITQMKPREHPCEAAIEIIGVSQVCDDGSQVCSGALYIHSATQQPKAGHPFIRTHAEGGIWSKPSHVSMGSPICAMSPLVHLVVPFNHTWSTNFQLTALSTHDIMCNRIAYNERSSSIFRLSVPEKIHSGTQRCSGQPLRTELGFAAMNKPSCPH